MSFIERLIYWTAYRTESHFNLGFKSDLKFVKWKNFESLISHFFDNAWIKKSNYIKNNRSKFSNFWTKTWNFQEELKYCRGSPEVLCHATVVSLWLVIPIALTWSNLYPFDKMSSVTPEMHWNREQEVVNIAQKTWG